MYFLQQMLLEGAVSGRTVFVDFNFVKDGKTTFIKELAYVIAGHLHAHTKIYKSPYENPRHKQPLYTELTWNDGNEDYCRIKDDLIEFNHQFYTLYVFGKYKRRRLQELLPQANIWDISGCININELPTRTAWCGSCNSIKCPTSRVLNFMLYNEVKGKILPEHWN